MATDWNEVRAEFPALKQWTFLNSATFGQLPRRATEAILQHLARRDALACSDFLGWFDDADEIRRDIAQLIHAELDDIAFFPNAATAFALLVNGIDWKPGDRIVTLDHEFPNNIYFPALLAERGVEFVETAWDGFYDALTPNTRLVAISMVSYVNGFRPPVLDIGHCLRQRGILFYLDGTQGLGALRLNTREVPISMLAVHGYKWMLSPTGAGFAYVDPPVRSWLAPATIGWRSHYAWRQVNSLHHGAPEFGAAAEKYEGGMLPFPSLYGMGASVRLMLDIGPSEIEGRVLDLAAQLTERLRGLGAILCDGESPYFRNTPVVAARFEGHDAPVLAQRLKERRVLVSARHGHLRVSVHFYNNEQDLERLAEELTSLIG
jgi:cysteine desulfurase / selenocysteine lyase